MDACTFVYILISIHYKAKTRNGFPLGQAWAHNGAGNIYLTYSLNSFTGSFTRLMYGPIMKAIQGDTRSLDYGSYVHMYVVISSLWLVRTSS